MTRSGDTGVTITIRIKFLNQDRNSADPKAPGAAADTPAAGQAHRGPDGDPGVGDPRRAWATDIATGPWPTGTGT